ncbi:hypothetical protein ABGV37_15430, partial [Escherichia coli]
MLPEGFAWTDGENNVVPVTAAHHSPVGCDREGDVCEGGEINTRQLQMKERSGAPYRAEVHQKLCCWLACQLNKKTGPR